TFTPDPLVRKNVSGTDVRLIAYDDTLQKVLSADTRAPSAAVVAGQRFLAETAMITGERPHQSRTVVVLPPRRWNPDAGLAKALVANSPKAPWLHAVRLRDVESLPPVNRVLAPQKDTSTLTAAQLRQVRNLNARIKRFTSIFQPPNSFQPPDSGFTLGVMRA